MTPKQSRGFDGLYHPDPSMECGCYLDDLRPCGETRTGCRGGFAIGLAGIFGPKGAGSLLKNPKVPR